MPKLLNNVARTAMFCTKNPQVDVRQVVNLLVCSRYPQEVLRPQEGVAGFSRPDEQGQPWLWQARFAVQEIAIVVCRDLPLEAQFYDWLVFVPSDNKRWPETVKEFLRARRADLFDFARRLHPEEFEKMNLDIDYKKIFSELDPKKRHRLKKGFRNLVLSDLKNLAEDEPEDFEYILSSLKPEQLADALTDEQLEEILRRRQEKKNS